MAIPARNPTPLQTLIRQLIEAGISLESLPVQDDTGVARIQVATPGELERLLVVVDSLGLAVVRSDEDSVSVLTLQRPH